jgi:hypothetical protein
MKQSLQGLPGSGGDRRGFIVSLRVRRDFEANRRLPEPVEVKVDLRCGCDEPFVCDVTLQYSECACECDIVETKRVV